MTWHSIYVDILKIVALLCIGHVPEKICTAMDACVYMLLLYHQFSITRYISCKPYQIIVVTILALQCLAFSHIFQWSVSPY